MQVVEITVHRARHIHTMNDALPHADAVAVADGMIVEVGSVETMRPWLDAHPHTFDDTFADKILLPGFVDPHLHPSLAATLLPMHFLTAMEWRLPDRTAPALKSHDAFVGALRELDATTPGSEPVFTWGFHDLWHGEVDRRVLDEVSTARPIVVWQRSFHEIFMNTAAMRHFELDLARLASHPQVDVDRGRFFETGMGIAAAAMGDVLTGPERFLRGLELTARAVHAGGHTTIGDLTASQFDRDDEWAALTAVLDTPETPFRVQMIPMGARALRDDIGRDDPAAWLADYEAARGGDKLFFRRHVKLFTDGGFYAQLMRVQPPGFIDGHQGEWMMPPERFVELARAFWNAGCQIHVHCTGDMGLELAIDTLATLQWERPRFDHRFTIEHMGLSNPEQLQRLASLGGLVSANVYYVHELGKAYWEHSVGHERASQMARVGTAMRNGIPTAFHSDFTMAPAEPLTSAWAAVNRVGEDGEVLGPHERVTVHQALRAITIDAAYVLGMEFEIGSIRAGKKADFTVLEADPYEVDPMELRNVPIWGTVFEGRPFPLAATDR